MKVSIIVTMTLDGFIARSSHHLSTEWSSKEDKQVFVRLTKQAGTIVMGKNTFETIGRALPERRNIVLTSATEDAPEGVEFTNEAPGQLVSRLQSEGVEHLMVCGGATVYDAFIRAGLVDDIYVTLQPRLFGAGITLFKDELDVVIELLTAERLEQTLLLHYKVLR